MPSGDGIVAGGAHLLGPPGAPDPGHAHQPGDLVPATSGPARRAAFHDFRAPDSRAVEPDATSNRILETTSANQSTVQDGRVYFTAATDPTWSQATSATFTSTNGGGWFTHPVDMASDGGGAAMGVDRIATR